MALALAMGVQNAAARKLAVADLTTTVLDADHHRHGRGPRLGGRDRRPGGPAAISVAAMLVGALVGAVFVLHMHIVYPLVIALIILAAVAVTAAAAASQPPNSPAPRHEECRCALLPCRPTR